MTLKADVSQNKINYIEYVWTVYRERMSFWKNKDE